jgi:RNA polymerase sigma-70 factor (ECF subfamily)
VIVIAEADSVLARARAAWPEVVLDDAIFVAYVADADDGGGELDIPALYLGCACIHGDPHALAAFERAHLDALPRMLARITTDAATIDEVKQRLRIKLFVADGIGPPTIARYRRGSLPAWLRVVACRLAIDVLRQRHLPLVGADEPALERTALADDPVLALIKVTYRDRVAAAFVAALGALSPTDRATLRFYFVDNLGTEEVGRIYQLSKSAVSRRLARCRAALLADVKQRLMGELGIAEAELDSVMKLVRSQLHLSLPRILGS